MELLVAAHMSVTADLSIVQEVVLYSGHIDDAWLYAHGFQLDPDYDRLLSEYNEIYGRLMSKIRSSKIPSVYFDRYPSLLFFHLSLGKPYRLGPVA